MAARNHSYDSFLRSIQPVILGLTSCHAELDRQRLWNMRGGEDRRMLAADYRIDSASDDHFDLTAEFTVAIQAIEQKGGPEEKNVLKIQCAFYGHFHADAKINKQHVRRFADSEARIFFVPYMRQFVADMTARMSIPPVMIPLAIGTKLGHERKSLPAKPGSKRAVRTKKA